MQGSSRGVRPRRRPVARTVLVCLAASASAAGAQAAPDTVPIPLESLEVRILRTPIREHLSPLAVAALGEVDLRQGRSGAFLEEALRGLPGVHVQNRYNFAVGERVVVRGFGGRAQFGARGVRIVVDGIPATLPDGQGTLDHLDVGSLGRVEVVRGAASALFGNASGGVLMFESRLPAPRPVQLEAEYVGGSHGLSRTQATATGTLNGTGYLLNLSTQGWQGYRPNPLDASGEGVFGTADRLALNGQLRRAVAGGAISLTVNHLDLDSQNPGQLLRSQVEEETRTAHGAGPVNNVVRRAGKEIQQTQLGARWEGAVASLDGEVALFGITRRTINPIVPTIIDLDRDAGGARLHLSREEATGLGPLRWHAGVEAEVMFDDRLNFVNEGGERGRLTVDQRERVRSAGVFGQANVPLPAGAVALAGLRWDRHDFRAWDHVARSATDPSRTGQRTMDQLSPSLGVNVPVGPVNLFGNVGTVFETPSTTELGNRPDGEGGFNPDLEPQRGVSTELGVRGRLGALVAFELTGYRAWLENEIVRFQVETQSGRDFFRNAGESRHTGAEATLSAAAPSGIVDGRLTYTYTDARFTRFVQDGVDVSGNRIPGLAPQRAEALLRLHPGVLAPRLAGLFAEGVASYVDNVPVNDRNTPGFAAPAYLLLDLRAGTRGWTLGSVTVAPWAAVTNLLDAYYVASVVPNAAGATPAAARFYDPGPGRSFQLGVRGVWGPGN